MPNYVVNVLRVGGADERRMEQIKAFVRTESHAETKPDRVFDFQKIVPMPEELSVIDGSEMGTVMSLYARYCRPGSEYDPDLGVDEETFHRIRMTPEEVERVCLSPRFSGKYIPMEETISDSDRELLKRPCRLIDDPDDVFGGVEVPALVAGHRYTMNQLHYGHRTWYGWCREYWGTKWNSCDSKELEDGSGWRYETAWSCSEPVVRTMSVIFPEVEFTLRYADEDYGSNCGLICYQNGEKTKEQFPDTDKVAVEYAIWLWEGVSPEEAGYRWDETCGRYRWVEDDE